MKTKLIQEKFRWVSVMFFACFFVQAASAYTDHQISWHTFEWDAERGVIRCTIRYYQTFGGSGDGHCGFEEDGGVTVTVGSAAVNIEGKSDSPELDRYEVVRGNVILVKNPETGKAWTLGNPGESENWYTVTFDVQIPSSSVNTTVNYSIVGKWWRRGPLAEDQQINFYDGSVTTTWERSAFSTSGYTFTEDNGRPAVRLSWNRPDNNANANHFGNIALADANRRLLTAGQGETVSFSGQSVSGSFMLHPSSGGNYDPNNTAGYTYHVVQRYTPTDNDALTYETSTTESTCFQVPAYTQVSDFTASFDGSSRQILLSWSMPSIPSAPGEYVDDNFRINCRQVDNGSGQAETNTSYLVSYEPGQKNYELAIDVEEGTDADFYFEIYRTFTDPDDARPSVWRRTYAKMDTLQNVNANHIRPDELFAEFTEDGSAVRVTWTSSNGGVWSEGTKVTLTRLNLTYSSSEDITLSRSDYERGEYTDAMIQLCNEYQYKMQLVPNEKYGGVPSVYTDPDKTLIKMEKGDLLAFSASKGYFGDRVELSWTKTGLFDEFAVERKEYGQDDSFYKKILTEPNSSTSTDYTVHDATAEPGKIYQYRVVGLAQCADTVLESDEVLEDVGFRTPTGDIYGRVTFENGQAEEGVEVYLESDLGETGRSLYLDGRSGTRAVIPDSAFLQDATGQISLQAYVKRNSGYGDILAKEGMYALGINSLGQIYFSAGANTLLTDTVTYGNRRSFMHLTAVKDEGAMRLYVDGKLVNERDISQSVPATEADFVIGGSDFSGYVDEVRIWNTALDPESIAEDYNRYLVGNETGLVAYYTFDYSVERNLDNEQGTGQFFDQSYDKLSVYGEHHGILENVLLSDTVPSTSQLGYRAYTGADGSYAIHAIPYVGGGTAYTIIPRLGIHEFSPQREDRYINSGAQSHTVNFTDVSSFDVEVTVVYEGGTYPVQGVSFTIDGVTAMDGRGQVYTTDAAGMVTLQVPVGTHEVKAVKDGHVFAIDGRICNSDSTDLNYQDRVAGRIIEDITMVKYMGRVAGGTVQEAYPVGHSLSENNLADNMQITLTHAYTGTTYDMVSDTVTKVYLHGPDYYARDSRKSNAVFYNEDGAVISVNNETGEFVAYLRPERYTLKINAEGHPNIPGNNSELNLSSAFTEQYELYEHSGEVTVETRDTIFTYDYGRPILDGNDTVSYVVTDTTILVRTETRNMQFKDSVMYNSMQKFIERVKPEVSIVQTRNNEPLDYYGSEVLIQTDLTGHSDTVALVEGGTYLFGRPVFQQGTPYTLDISVFEGYRYNGLDTRVDRVPTRDARISFTNNIQGAQQDTVITADSLGHAVYTFQAGGPNVSSGERTLSALVAIGSGNGSQTTFPWEQPSSFVDGLAYVVGGSPTGTNFVTGGPDRVVTVLRDPPGSGSYAYLEQGVSFTTSSTYSGTVSNEGSEGTTIGASNAVYQWHGVGSGVMNVAIEADNGTTVGVVHEESYTDANTKTATTTTTTRFQTSDAPEYVGAEGDVYVGYSTNLTFGQTNNVTVVSRQAYEQNEGNYENTFAETPDWVLVLKEGTNISENFSTLFVYPQYYIINTLIPNLERVRNELLMPYDTYSGRIEELQALANSQDTVFYLSYFQPSHPDYGKSNTDESISDRSHGNPEDMTDGPSYRVIYKNDIMVRANSIVPLPDTISFLNQAIEGWEQTVAANEKAKVEAELMQNYSFQAGSNVEYSESYSGARHVESSFEIVVGMSVETEVSLNTIGIKTGLQINETVTTTQGSSSESEEELSHCKGFVLAEEGTDYLSVDVCREKNEDEGYGTDGDLTARDYYPSFIFKTRGGVTSCPYEGASYTHYYNPGTLIGEATVSMEAPTIYTDNDFLENVPCGEPARFTLYMTNESDARESMWFNLRVIEASNPYGAQFSMDGGAIGNGRSLIVPNGEILVKTIEIEKGAVLNYDSLMLVLESQCQPSDNTDTYDDIADTLMLHVHFTPACTDVAIRQPATNWTYNTRLATAMQDGIEQHYMPVVLGGFNVNYPDFDHIEIQYKPASESDENYITLMRYYNDSTLFRQATENGLAAAMIEGSEISYRWFMDNLQDQRYDLRAVSVCNISNSLVYNYSDVSSGIKDLYNPRLFGSPQPADGILSVEDEIRLDFNEPIAAGYMTNNNFQVRGVRNGTETDHSVSVRLDGMDDYLASDAVRNLTVKDFTLEMWINGNAQDAVLFSHGNVNDHVAFGLTSDNHLYASVNGRTLRSTSAFVFDQGSWAHVAMVYTADGYVSLYYNYQEVLAAEYMGAYRGIGNMTVGRDIDGQNPYAGQIDNLRVWETARSVSELQLNSLTKLSGNEVALMLYCPMDEGRGSVVEDQARGANLAMYGCEWATPEGRSTLFDGATGYLGLNTSAAVITSDMDFTIEFWFKAAEGSRSATMLSNGRGDGNEMGGSQNRFAIGFDASGNLYFANNAHTVLIDGDYADNNWHHIAVTAGRVQGRVQIYMDGALSTYFNVERTGGISNSEAYVGAKAWYEPDDAITLHVDEFFQGAIDEVRFWNLYKTAALVEEEMYKRLDGDEAGLLAWYPFEYYMEWQGTEELNYTLQDQKIPSDPSYEAPEAVLTGTAIESADIPPIVDKGPVSDLSFSYVVNDDALIINLEEPYESVEKTIVTFTASEIMDQNGNELLSPITWSAYIDRNQLRWSQSEWTDTKRVYEEYEFTVDIVNNGGSIQNYTIENLPSWLTASPSQGKINPASTQHVNFQVRQDLNIGTYDEVIYLRDENNVGEPLALNLTVVGDVPQWEVDPSAFQYSMSVFGQLRFNNIFSMDENDMLAAFEGTQCVGVAHSVYNEDVDMWYAMLTVYSNRVVHQDLSFRMWDASTGITYQAVPEQEIRFTNNAIYGTPMDPLIFDGQTLVFQDLSLDEGWNWISFNLASDNLSDVNTALAGGAWSTGDQIKVMQEEDGRMVYRFADYSAREGRWKNAFALNNTNMFMIYSSKPQVLSLDGVWADALETPVTLKAGRWNYIGFVPNVNLTVRDALAGYEAREGDVVKSIDGFAMYSGHNWIGSLQYMEPNAGYMLLNTDNVDKTLVYPTSSTIAGNTYSVAKASPWPDNMGIVAYSKLVEPGDELSVWVDGQERGHVRPVAMGGKTLQFAIVAGDGNTGRVVFRLEKPDGSCYHSTNQIAYRSNQVTGSPDKPYELFFEEESGHAGACRVDLMPNPAKENVFVEIRLPSSAEVLLEMLDAHGKVVYMRTVQVDGFLRHEIDLEPFAAGTYFVRLSLGGETCLEKLIRL